MHHDDSDKGAYMPTPEEIAEGKRRFKEEHMARKRQAKSSKKIYQRTSVRIATDSRPLTQED